MQPNKSVVDSTSNPWLRETIDSFGVALILAFLFRAFVAEAFVIPTGSMAPTLMGAHKDVTCSQCGQSYQTAASNEFNNETGEIGKDVVIATTCPLCRYQQAIDPVKRPNDSTFSGDRILVSKLAYIQSNPQRWQVFVFKNPLAARQNFIKRLVGLPNETLVIEHGDIYVKPDGEKTAFEIARKPAEIVEVNLQPLNDTSHRPIAAVKAGLPSPWQPQGPIPNSSDAGTAAVASGWNVTSSETNWNAEFSGAGTPASSDSLGGFHWLRYYHYTLKPWQWYQVAEKNQLSPEVLPRTSQLISDFTHYNANPFIEARDPFVRARAYQTEMSPFGPRSATNATVEKALATDGWNWVGDLACEFEVDINSDSGALAIDLVEAGIHYLLTIDVSSGKAKIEAIKNGKSLEVFGAPGQPLKSEIHAETSVRGNRNVSLKYANVDNTLHLWIDGHYVDFQSTNFVEPSLPPENDQHRPQYSVTDSGDAAPVGIAASGQTKIKVNRAQVWRDIYYTAVKNNRDIALDYPSNALTNAVSLDELEKYQAILSKEFPASEVRGHIREDSVRRDLFFGSPDLWANSNLFSHRRSVDFTLGPDQFFPMGDNSIESSDGRLWSQKFVQRDLLIGRAALVFWPHPWKRPIPFLPDFKRMGIIR